MSITVLFLVLTIATSVASPLNQIHLLKPHSGSAGHKNSKLNCLSWRLAVETNNIQKWKQVPEACEKYVGHYMLGKQYRKDVDLVAAEAYEYAKGLNITKDGKDVWVFDIDETTLSNLPYYARDTVAFGAIPYNSTAFNAWVAEAKAPPIPGSLKLYKRLVRLGLKIVFLTGSHDYQTKPRAKNLKDVGYTTWEKLILNKCVGEIMMVEDIKRTREKSWSRPDIRLEAIWVINGAIYLVATLVIALLNFRIQCTTSVNN